MFMIYLYKTTEEYWSHKHYGPNQLLSMFMIDLYKTTEEYGSHKHYGPYKLLSMLINLFYLDVFIYIMR